MDSVVHFEIPYDDQARAQEFYENVFGWKWAKVPNMDYHMVSTTETDPETMAPKNPGAINGDMMEWKDPRHAPTIVIGVADLESQLKKIEAAGGKTLVPMMDVGEYGKYAQVMDTEGNALALWQVGKPQ